MVGVTRRRTPGIVNSCAASAGRRALSAIFGQGRSDYHRSSTQVPRVFFSRHDRGSTTRAGTISPRPCRDFRCAPLAPLRVWRRRRRATRRLHQRIALRPTTNRDAARAFERGLWHAAAVGSPFERDAGPRQDRRARHDLSADRAPFTERPASRLCDRARRDRLLTSYPAGELIRLAAPESLAHSAREPTGMPSFPR